MKKAIRCFALLLCCGLLLTQLSGCLLLTSKQVDREEKPEDTVIQVQTEESTERPWNVDYDFTVAKEFLLNVYGADGSLYGDYTVYISGFQEGNIPYERTDLVENAVSCELSLEQGSYTLLLTDNADQSLTANYSLQVTEDGLNSITVDTNFGSRATEESATEETAMQTEVQQPVLDPQTQYNINIFLSNFSEQGFNEWEGGRFYADTAQASQLLDFVSTYMFINTDTRDYDLTEDYCNMCIPLDRINERLNRFFGRSVTLADGASCGYLVQEDCICFPYGVGASHPELTVVEELTAQSDGSYKASFRIYTAESSSTGGNMVDKSYYYLDSLTAAQHWDLSYHARGEAVVRPYRLSDGTASYQLIAYEVFDD